LAKVIFIRLGLGSFGFPIRILQGNKRTFRTPPPPKKKKPSLWQFAKVRQKCALQNKGFILIFTEAFMLLLFLPVIELTIDNIQTFDVIFHTYVSRYICTYIRGM
jgi:hypothetical protein